jgi:hypothetical protein
VQSSSHHNPSLSLSLSISISRATGTGRAAQQVTKQGIAHHKPHLAADQPAVQRKLEVSKAAHSKESKAPVASLQQQEISCTNKGHRRGVQVLLDVAKH